MLRDMPSFIKTSKPSAVSEKLEPVVVVAPAAVPYALDTLTIAAAILIAAEQLADAALADAMDDIATETATAIEAETTVAPAAEPYVLDTLTIAAAILIAAEQLADAALADAMDDIATETETAVANETTVANEAVAETEAETESELAADTIESNPESFAAEPADIETLEPTISAAEPQVQATITYANAQFVAATLLVATISRLIAEITLQNAGLATGMEIGSAIFEHMNAEQFETTVSTAGLMLEAAEQLAAGFTESVDAIDAINVQTDIQRRYYESSQVVLTAEQCFALFNNASDNNNTACVDDTATVFGDDDDDDVGSDCDTVNGAYDYIEQNGGEHIVFGPPIHASYFAEPKN
ncbi:hypothetical protein BC831DRAFT_510793 [Entophlyctis helioformis]|nr:hypothetical protein BC831DRAFT_510793 [Entophlyctis helioformis]